VTIWLSSNFCVKIGKSSSETLAQLTLACGEYAMKKLSVLNSIGSSRKDEKLRNIT
jgi:hypothetical protein